MLSLQEKRSKINYNRIGHRNASNPFLRLRKLELHIYVYIDIFSNYKVIKEIRKRADRGTQKL